LTVAVKLVGTRWAPQKLLKATRVHDSRCQRLHAIFVMQPRQDRGGNDSVAIIMKKSPALIADA